MKHVGYVGYLVEESLKDNRTLNELMTESVRVTNEENPADRWHIYTVFALREQIDLIKNSIKAGWYAHFTKGDELIVVFNNAEFVMKRSDRSTWKEAIDHGLKQNIPREQLDFLN